MGKIRSAQVSVSIHQHLCLRHHLHAPLWVLCPRFFPWFPFKTQTHLRQSFVQWTRNHLDLCRSDNRQLLQHSCMSTELMVRMTLAGFYVAGVTQLKCECLCGISPSAMPPLLGFHACFHLRRFLSRCLSTVPKSRVRERERERKEHLSAASCHAVWCLPIPPCHSSSLPFAVFTAKPLGASLYQFPAGLQEPCTRQSGMMRFLMQASLSVMPFSPARFNLHCSVFPSA